MNEEEMRTETRKFKELSLSDKIGSFSGEFCLSVKDVKEFIKLLKDEIERGFDNLRYGWYKTDDKQVAQDRWNVSIFWQNINVGIDKLAGEKLIENENTK